MAVLGVYDFCFCGMLADVDVGATWLVRVVFFVGVWDRVGGFRQVGDLRGGCRCLVASGLR